MIDSLILLLATALYTKQVTVVNRSSFFYDERFGIEGSVMAILFNLLACCILFLVGRRLQKER